MAGHIYQEREASTRRKERFRPLLVHHVLNIPLTIRREERLYLRRHEAPIPFCLSAPA